MASDDRVLVLGATGILRPAALRLARDGRTVVAVARGRVDLTALEAEGGARVEVVPVDVTRPSEVLAASGPDQPLGRPVTAALVYVPRPFAEAFETVLAGVRGPTVRVLTSAAAAPDAPDWRAGPRPDGETRLLLGWTGEPGAPRWHTPDEVSAAALAALADGADAVLGRVRPWTGRPT